MQMLKLFQFLSSLHFPWALINQHNVLSTLEMCCNSQNLNVLGVSVCWFNKQLWCLEDLLTTQTWRWQTLFFLYHLWYYLCLLCYSSHIKRAFNHNWNQCMHTMTACIYPSLFHKVRASLRLKSQSSMSCMQHNSDPPNIWQWLISLIAKGKCPDISRHKTFFLYAALFRK